MVQFVDRKRTNETKRIIKILNSSGNEMEAEITEAPNNVEIQGTPINASVMNELAQKVEAANDVSGRVANLESKVSNITYNMATDTFMF